MDKIKDTDNRKSGVDRSRRNHRSRRKRTKVLNAIQDFARKPHIDSGRRSVSNEATNRRNEKREREPSAFVERKRIPDSKEEQGLPLTRHSKRRSWRSRDRRRASSVSSGSSRALSDDTFRDIDKIGNDKRRTKQSQRSKGRSLRSGSLHDDSTGHFRIRAGTIIGNRYKIIRQVGLGTFGRVVECLQIPDRNQDRGHRASREPDRHVAIKIVRNVKRYYESAVIEARIISEANRRGGRGRTHCVVLHDTFRIDGHFCLVFENLGPSLYDFLKRNNYQPFPMLCVQDFTVQLLETLEFLHGIRMIHTDLKIENILLINDRESNYRNQRVPESTRIKVIDFGGACYDSDKKSSVINTRQYRAPEVMLGTGWSMPSDMWSAGCILAELYSGELLFATHDDVEHLALIERKIGLFPRPMVDSSKHGQDPELARTAFDSKGCHLLSRVLTPEHYSFVRRALPLDSHIRSEDGWFLRLLRRILVIDPHERATAHEALQFLRRIRRDVVRCN